MATTAARIESGAGPRPVRGIGVAAALIPLLVFLVLAFPKGGVRIYEIPITFGYLISPLMLLGALARARGVAVPQDRALAFVPALLLAGWSAAVLASNGTDAPGYTFSYFVSALYLPLFGLIFFSDLTMSDRSSAIERALVWAVRFVVAYGIFLFLYRLTTGRWIEIPYLTVNADDVGTLERKYINRGGIFKLISTYNNGNIFGVAMCVLGPLYLALERRRLWALAFYGALFLTLSRTVWIGIVLVLTLRTFAGGFRWSKVFYLLAMLAGAAVVIDLLLILIGRDLHFLFDSNLGNRAVQLHALNDPHLVPDNVGRVLPEIVYTGVLSNYGYAGLLLFVAHLLAPSALLVLERTGVFGRSRASACLQGLLVYPILAASDSAYILPPVMMIFWMIAGLGLWYAHENAKGGRALATVR